MGLDNNFQHAAYSRVDPGARVRYQDFSTGAAPGSAAWRQAVGELGQALAGAGVRAVVLLYGSPLSTDLFGAQRLDEGILKRGYSRGIPGVDALLALMREQANGLPPFPGGARPPFPDEDGIKELLDRQLQDTANVSNRTLALLSDAVHQTAGRLICLRQLWPSTHHHLGRTIGALQFAERLARLCGDRGLQPGDRILVLAYGHAGQLLALLSNFLVPGRAPTRTAILEHLAAYDATGVDLTDLRRMLEAGNLLKGSTLDVVTFGTAVRYGWETSTLGKLLHIVNHRPLRADGKRWLAKMELPQITVEMPYALGGDYVQQLAVAGTDAVPEASAAQAVNKALWELLEPYDGFERWLECARKGVRCPNDGDCLLVDYHDGDATPEPTPSRHVFGHAVYTRPHTLLFHFTEIVHAFYR